MLPGVKYAKLIRSKKSVWNGKTYAVGMTTADTTSGENMWHPQSQIWINGVKYPIRDHKSDGGYSNAYQILVVE